MFPASIPRCLGNCGNGALTDPMDVIFLPFNHVCFQHSTCDLDLFNFTAVSGMTHYIFKYSHDWVLLSNNSLIINNNKEKYWRQNLSTRSTLVGILLLRLRGWIFYEQPSFRTFVSPRIRIGPLRTLSVVKDLFYLTSVNMHCIPAQPIIKVLQYTDRCTNV